MWRRKKFVIGGVVILMALGFLLFRGFMSGATYYFEVRELLAKGSSIYNETVRVNGQVVPGSVQQRAQGTELTFRITDVNGGGENVSIFYKGVVPDSFKVGEELVAEGHLGADGIFQAHSLMPKCPSRYVPAG